MNKNNQYKTFTTSLFGILLISSVIILLYIDKISNTLEITLYAIIGISIFLLLREFWCWYWKINKINNNLEKIINKLDNK